MAIAKLAALSSFLLLAAACIDSSTAVDCPDGPMTTAIMNLASGLAQKGFDLTEEDYNSMFPEFTSEQQEQKYSKEESEACNAQFKLTYIDGLLKLGKSQADVDDWIKKVYSSGELRAPKKA